MKHFSEMVRVRVRVRVRDKDKYEKMITFSELITFSPLFNTRAVSRELESEVPLIFFIDTRVKS